MVKKRQNTRWIKDRRDKDGNLLCLVPTCNDKRERYKKVNKFRNYCKKHGWQDMKPFTNWGALRLRVFKRDNFKCVKCGERPTKEIKMDNYYDNQWHKSYNKKQIREWYKFTKFEIRGEQEIAIVDDDSQLVGDHIIPIALGGDEWDINNIQTLCVKCNKIKTKKDVKNIAKFRNIEKKLIKGQKQIKT